MGETVDVERSKMVGISLGQTKPFSAILMVQMTFDGTIVNEF